MKKIKGSLSKYRHGLHKLKTQLFGGYMITFALIAVLMLAVLFTGVKQLITDQIGQSRMDVLKQVSERSNAIKNTTITISNLYRYDSQVYNCLSEEQPNNWKEQTHYLNMLKKNYDNVFRDVGIAYDVVLVGENGFQYSSLSGESYDFKSMENQLWYRRNYDGDGDIRFISSFKEQFDKTKSEENRYVFSAFRKIFDQSGQKLGTILVNIDEKYLESLYSSLTDQKSNIYIFDSKGNIVSSKNKSLLGTNFIGVENFRNLYGENQYHIIQKSGEDFLLSNYYDSQAGWTIVEEMPCSVILAPLNKTLKLLVWALIICLVLAFGISYYIADRISSPILALCQSMNLVKQGDLNVISNLEGYEEIIMLQDSFHEMESEIKKLLENVKQKEENKRRTEMDFLRAQINPHFLYNTLFSIQCLIEIHKNQQAVQMVAAFIDLLRMTLSVDTDLITLEEEFESTRKYVILQQIRYGERICFESDMGEGAKDCLVPPLIIQPIVENAIFHGLEPKDEGGLIVVESVIEDGILCITVSDDGLGMEEAELGRLQGDSHGEAYKRPRSIGILNVQNRIKINFGEEFGVDVISETGVGTTVTLRLPIDVLRQQKKRG